MKQMNALANLALWVGAIVASSTTGAPDLLTCILLPCLAAVSVAVSWNHKRRA